MIGWFEINMAGALILAVIVVVAINYGYAEFIK